MSSATRRAGRFLLAPLLAAELDLDHGDPTKAMGRIEGVLARSPGHPRALVLLAEARDALAAPLGSAEAAALDELCTKIGPSAPAIAGACALHAAVTLRRRAVAPPRGRARCRPRKRPPAIRVCWAGRRSCWPTWASPIARPPWSSAAFRWRTRAIRRWAGRARRCASRAASRSPRRAGRRPGPRRASSPCGPPS
jgi:hypothetical protein